MNDAYATYEDALGKAVPVCNICYEPQCVGEYTHFEDPMEVLKEELNDN